MLKHNGNEDNIKAVTMDMSAAFIRGAVNYLPNAEITFDKFHVVKNKSIQISLSKTRFGRFYFGLRIKNGEEPKNLLA